jgi:SAM-dependent methyltransferase
MQEKERPMASKRLYDLMYRFRAPWEGSDRPELRRLVADGRCAPETLRAPGAAVARAIDLGCGAGGVAIELAQAGFEVTGVDFSEVALRKARRTARRQGLGPDRIRFVQGDLTAGHVPGVEGPFDLLVDYSTLDDLRGDKRRAMAAYMTSLARPGSRLFLYAWEAGRQDLPRMSFTGPSRMYPGLDPGEAAQLFGHAFGLEVIEPPTPPDHTAIYLLEGLPTAAPASPTPVGAAGRAGR